MLPSVLDATLPLKRGEAASSEHRRWALLVILAIFLCYATGFIWRTSFVIDGERYFSLFDDAMISMRYARNLAAGHGLVWNRNPGAEQVEGYTNLLWVLYMAGVHLLPLPASKMSLPVQLTGAFALALNLVLLARLAGRLSQGSTYAVAAALCLTAFYLPLNTWALQGMEVSVLALLVTTIAWLAIRSLESPRVPRLLYPLLGLGTLVRLDMVVPFLTVLLALVHLDRAKRREHLLLGTVVILLVLGGQSIFRWSYYGHLLPNTYYLKMTGYPVLERLARGTIVFAEFAVLLVAGLLLLVPALRFVPRDRRTALLLALIAAQCAYSIYVGGDAWEWAGGANRYIAITMPLLFLLFALAVGALARMWPAPLVTGALAASVIATNVLVAPGAWRSWTLLGPSLHVTDNADRVRLALALRTTTAQDATVAVVWAGAQPYFLERRTIDLLGKNDLVIAHRPMRRAPPGSPAAQRLRFFYPGHLKYDYGFSIGQLKPDVVTELWRDPHEALPYLAAHYRKVEIAGLPVFLRTGSPRIAGSLVGRSD